LEQGTCQAVTFRHHVADAVKERAVAIALARFVSTAGLVISRLVLAAPLQLFQSEPLPFFV
jgi:hypothetical protein